MNTRKDSGSWGGASGMAMRRMRTAAVTALLVLVVAAGCASGNDEYETRFLRYEKLPDGTRAAVLAQPGEGASPPEFKAYVDLDDLKPGDLVMVRDTGKNWDEPQWKPSSEVVSRATK